MGHSAVDEGSLGILHLKAGRNAQRPRRSYLHYTHAMWRSVGPFRNVVELYTVYWEIEEAQGAQGAQPFTCQALALFRFTIPQQAGCSKMCFA